MRIYRIKKLLKIIAKTLYLLWLLKFLANNLGESCMQTYIFDFDGTLADSGKTGILATQDAFKDFSLPIPDYKTVNYYMAIPIEVSFKKMAPQHVFNEQEFKDLMDCFREHYKKMS